MATLIAAVVDTASPCGSVVGLERLARRLVRLGDCVGHAAHRPARTVAATVHAWLGHVGVLRAGAVPPEVVLWLTWADGLRERAHVHAGWRILAVDAALGERMALQRRGAPPGAWLPLLTNGHGDHHVFLADHGGIAAWYCDERTAPTHPITPLADYASALLAAWA